MASGRRSTEYDATASRAGRADPRALPRPDRHRRAGLAGAAAGRCGARGRSRRPDAPAPGRLPAAPPRRLGRHGDRLRGDPGIAGPARGPEDAPAPAARRRDPAGAVPARGPRRGPAAPYPHRAGLRRRRARRPALLHHAVHPRPGPGHRPSGSQAVATRSEPTGAARGDATARSRRSPWRWALRTGRFPADEVETRRSPGTVVSQTHRDRRAGHRSDDVALAAHPAIDRSCPTSPRPSIFAAWRGSASRSPRPWNMPISRASCTATSSPPISCSTPRAQVWITDFGLAKAQGSDELTRTGDIVGTLRYMAPGAVQRLVRPAQRRLRPGGDLVRDARRCARVRRVGPGQADRASAARRARCRSASSTDRSRATWRRSCSRPWPGSRASATRRPGNLAEDLRRFVAGPADPGAPVRHGRTVMALEQAQPAAGRGDRRRGDRAAGRGAALIALREGAIQGEPGKPADDLGKEANGSRHRSPNRTVCWRSATSTEARRPSRTRRSARDCSG